MKLYNEEGHGTTAKTPRSDAGQDPTETLFIAHRKIVSSLDLTIHSLPWQAALKMAYEAHPERFVKGLPKPPQVPTAVWINPPQSAEKDGLLS